MLPKTQPRPRRIDDTWRRYASRVPRPSGEEEREVSLIDRVEDRQDRQAAGVQAAVSREFVCCAG